MRGSLYPGRAGELSESNAGVRCCEPFTPSTLLLPCMQALCAGLMCRPGLFSPPCLNTCTPGDHHLALKLLRALWAASHEL